LHTRRTPSPDARPAHRADLGAAGLAVTEIAVTEIASTGISIRRKSMTELVLGEQHGAVALLTLNRPKARNALSLDLILAMQEAFDACIADPGCRAIVVRGAEGHFCSGGDLSGMQQERSIAESRRRMDIFHRLARTIVAGPKPVVAAVEGYAAGA